MENIVPYGKVEWEFFKKFYDKMPSIENDYISGFDKL